MEVWKRFNEKEVSHSMAHYLQAVAGLKRAKGYARVGDIADQLGVSKSGVTSMLRSLRSRGLVDHERYGCVELTPVGQELADRTETNRAVLSLFFRDILGVSEEVAREDACMIEHLVSPEAMARLLRLTTLLQSTEPAAVTFVKALRRQFELCAEHCGECGFCRGDTCLLEPLEKEVPGRGASAGGGV
jgi:DtxR family Mn-dependent transcriptional regulator